MVVLALLACADGPSAAEVACTDGDGAACAALGRGEEACEAGHGESCAAAGRPAEACTAGHAASCRALGRLDEACRHGDGRSCWTLGAAARWERDDHAAALALFEQACQQGEPFGCAAAGDLERRDDLARALALYERACRLDGSGCALQQQTQALLEAAEPCADGDQEACVKLCLAADPRGCRAAADTLDGRCRAGDAGSCTALGTALARGWGLGSDPARAHALLWAGCRGNDPWGCLRLADAVEAGAHNPSPKTLAWLQNQVCDLQLWYGCAPH